MFPLRWRPVGQTPASLGMINAPPSVPVPTQTEPLPHAGLQVMAPLPP